MVVTQLFFVVQVFCQALGWSSPRNSYKLHAIPRKVTLEMDGDFEKLGPSSKSEHAPSGAVIPPNR